MGAERNIAALVFGVAAAHPERVAIRTPSHQISYGQMSSLVVSFANKMAQLGIGRSAVVALDTDKLDIAVALALACSVRGCAWTQASMAVANNRTLGVTHLLHDETKPYAPQQNQFRVDRSWGPQATASGERAGFDGFNSASDVAIFGQSSGTTGTAKLMAISAENAWNRSDQRLLLDPSPTPVVVSLFRPLHLGNFFNLVRVLARGGTLLAGTDYAFWAAQGNTFVLGAPNHFVEVFRRLQPPDRPALPLAWLGGGPISPRFLDTAFRYFIEVVNTYGSAEAGIICSKRCRETPTEDGVPLGRPAPETELQIVDEEHMPVPAGTEGIVRLRTPWQVSSYWGDPETSARVFHDGWFYPGDLGRVSSEGDLFISGRTNDQLNLGGAKFNATMIDDIIQSVPGVLDGICFAAPIESGVMRLAAVISVEDAVRGAEIAALVQTRVSEKMGPRVAPQRIYIADKIPRNPNGKPTRHLAAGAVAGLKPVELPAAAKG